MLSLFRRRPRDADRSINAAVGSYRITVHVVTRERFERLARAFRERPDAQAITMWPRQGEGAVNIYVVAPFTYGLLAHELRHAFEKDFHRGRHEIDP